MDTLVGMTQEVMTSLVTGGWIAFAGFGAFLAYKLALTTVISVSVLKIVGKVVDRFPKPNGGELNQRFMQIGSAAGMMAPFSDDEWKEILRRVAIK